MRRYIARRAEVLKAAASQTQILSSGKDDKVDVTKHSGDILSLRAGFCNGGLNFCSSGGTTSRWLSWPHKVGSLSITISHGR